MSLPSYSEDVKTSPRRLSIPPPPRLLRSKKPLAFPVLILTIFLFLRYSEYEIPGIDLNLPFHRNDLVFDSDQSLLRDKDGVAYTSERTVGGMGHHPILELIHRGRETAVEHTRINRGVTTLEDAVKDYQRAFGMNPPEGFDVWYNLARQLNSTAVPSLIPMAHTTVLPYLAMPPSMLRNRTMEILDKKGMLGIEINPLGNAGERIKLLEVDFYGKYRHVARDYPEFLNPIAHLLPTSDQPLTLAVWTEDNAFRIPSGKVHAKSIELAKRGQIWDEQALLDLEAEDDGKLGWRWACDPPITDSQINDTLKHLQSPVKSFISDPTTYADHCKHPEHLLQNGEMIMEEQVAVRRWEPVMSSSKLFRGAEMLGAPTRDTQKIVETPLPWKKKSHSKLFFRGGPTGIFHSQRWDWRNSQRDRLAFFTDRKKREENRDVVDVIERMGNGSYGKSVQGWGKMVDRYMDAGLVAKNIGWNCGKGSGFAMCEPNGGEMLPDCPGNFMGCLEMMDEIPWKGFVESEESMKYKYKLDIDGYGWTSRWRTELSSGSVILKATLYPEWWHAQAIPWYHYIPVRYDYKDLFDIMSFFTGSPDTPAGRGRDDLAEKIGKNGREFALEQLRWEDMQSYMLLFLLEYRRAWSLDRVAATYKLTPSS